MSALNVQRLPEKNPCMLCTEELKATAASRPAVVEKLRKRGTRWKTDGTQAPNAVASSPHFMPSNNWCNGVVHGRTVTKRANVDHSAWTAERGEATRFRTSQSAQAWAAVCSTRRRKRWPYLPASNNRRRSGFVVVVLSIRAPGWRAVVRHSASTRK